MCDSSVLSCDMIVQREEASVYSFLDYRESFILAKIGDQKFVVIVNHRRLQASVFTGVKEALYVTSIYTGQS